MHVAEWIGFLDPVSKDLRFYSYCWLCVGQTSLSILSLSTQQWYVSGGPKICVWVTEAACIHVPVWLHCILPRKMRLFKMFNTAQTKNTIHQVTTMLAASKNVLFPSHNHPADHWDWWPFTLIITLAGTWAIIKVSGYQYQWLAGGYDLEIGHFKKWPAWWLPGGQWFFVQCCLTMCSWISYTIGGNSWPNIDKGIMPSTLYLYLINLNNCILH